MVISIFGLLMTEHVWQMHVLKVWEPGENRYFCSVGSHSKSDYLDAELFQSVITPQIATDYSCGCSADEPRDRPATVFGIYNDFMDDIHEFFRNAALAIPYH